MKVLFVEPPKEEWFVMGEHLPPPYGIIQLGAYLEREVKDAEIKILDCNAEHVDWGDIGKRIESFNPDIVASSSLGTCNTYAAVRTLEIAKKVNSNILTVTGGQHFTVTAQESLQEYSAIDAIARGEGEQTFTELALAAGEKKANFTKIQGLSFRKGDKVVHNSPRPLIENLESLPYPGYHLVKDVLHRYHFTLMAGRNAAYVLIEGSRGCSHECTFCTQWRHWQSQWRLKSPQRIADEMAFCHNQYGSDFVWLTDDNFGAGTRPSDLANEIIKRNMPDVTWFVQARIDDIIRNRDALPRLRKSGLSWVLLGVENPDPMTLAGFKKDIRPEDAKTAVKLLQENGIFAHVMLIIGSRKDTDESIARTAAFADDLDPDLVMFGCLTPFPGTEVFNEAKANGWIEDFNWAHYDMIHAIMSTETLSAAQVQEKLYECYRSFYGPLSRKLRGLFSSSSMKRNVFWHMASRGITNRFESLLQRHAIE